MQPAATAHLPQNSGCRTSRAEILAAHLFFLFFVAPVLSPALGGMTLYLEGVLAALNPFYLHWLGQRRITGAQAGQIALLAAPLILLSPLALVKLLFLLNAVLFLLYADERRLFFLFRWLWLSLAVALAQGLAWALRPDLMPVLAPGHIARMIWGAQATQTFTNFHPLLLLPRFAGLSRESGFFAALIAAAALVAILRRQPNRSAAAGLGLLLATGWLVSLSKISVLIFLYPAVLRLRRPLGHLSPALCLGLCIAIAAGVTGGLLPFMLAHHMESLLHRLGAYAVLPGLQAGQLLFGIDDLSQADSPVTRALAGKFEQLAGFGGFILSEGALVGLLWFLLLRSFGLGAAGAVLLFLGTLNVSPLSSQNFVVLCHFAALCLLPRQGSRNHAPPAPALASA